MPETPFTPLLFLNLPKADEIHFSDRALLALVRWSQKKQVASAALISSLVSFHLGNIKAALAETDMLANDYEVGGLFITDLPLKTEVALSIVDQYLLPEGVRKLRFMTAREMHSEVERIFQAIDEALPDGLRPTPPSDLPPIKWITP